MTKIPSRWSGFQFLTERLSDPERRPHLIRFSLGIVVLLLLVPKVAPALHDIATRGEEPEEEVVPVEVVLVTTDRLDRTLPASGTLRAHREVELSAEVSGIVTGLHIDEGAEVAAGELLVQINDNDLRAELRGVEYQLEVMEEAALRQERLVAEGGTTRDAYDATLMRVNELRSARENLQAQLERTRVVAPFRGVVGLTHVHPGSYLTPATRIATLQNVDSVRIDFSVPERYSGVVTKETAVRFTVSGVDSVFHGSVYALEPRIDSRTRSMEVRAISGNEEGRLRPGSFANVELVLSSTDDAILLPPLALIPDAGQYVVMVARDGRAVRLPVDVESRSAERVHVTGGLQPGDKVIVSGLHRIRDGSAILPRFEHDRSDS